MYHREYPLPVFGGIVHVKTGAFLLSGEKKRHRKINTSFATLRIQK